MSQLQQQSLKFKHIETYLTQIFTQLYNSETIKKYLCNLSADPLNNPSPNVDLLQDGYLFLGFFDPEIEDKERHARLFLNILGSPLTKQPLDNITFLIEVVLPREYSIIWGQGQHRGIRIFDEVSKLIDQKLGIGIGEASMQNLRLGRIANSNYEVSSINIVISTATVKGFR